jgi:Sulfotransferase family
MRLAGRLEQDPRDAPEEGTRGRRFIFVGGAPRSGTTLVQNMLDCHPKILGAPEFLNLGRIVELRNRLRQGVDRGAIDAFASAPEVDRLTAQLIENLLLPLADRHGAPYLSEKTPSNALVFRELLELFPEARCIFVLRDPRAVIASMLEVGTRAAAAQGHPTQPWTRSLPAAVAYVQRYFRAARAAAAEAPERVLVLRYEALVTEPEAETRAICGFLGLPWTAAMLTPASSPHPGEQAIIRTEIWYDPASFRRDPDPAGIDTWKERLTARQKAVITLAFAGMPEVSGAGYPLRPDDLTPREFALGLGARLVERLGGRLRRALGPHVV